MKTTEQKRRQLIDDVQGSKRINVYDLTKYGGFGIIVTTETYKESELREEVLRTREEHKRRKVEIALNSPDNPGWSGWLDYELEVLTFEERLAMAEEVREGLESIKVPLPGWVTETLAESETVIRDKQI